jgi:hypothetical protein
MLDTEWLDICPLCNDIANVFYNRPRCLYYNCRSCGAIFLSKDLYLSEGQEKDRYLEHKNDVDDPGYQQFVSPVVDYVIENFNPDVHNGLDFGSGTGPVASNLLCKKGFKISRYDPFFYPDTKCLSDRYDFIVSCEVIEHFHRPYEEFLSLCGRLSEKGKLICMTSIYNESITFKDWHYKNDPTHVFIYQKNTFEWIRDNIGFDSLEIAQNLVILSK